MTIPPLGPETSSRRSSQRPGSLMAVLALVLAAFAGGLAGVAIDRLVLLPHMFRGHGFGHDGVPGRPPRDFRERFAREVGLTPEQQQRIDSIMDRQGREMRAVRGRVQPQVDSIVSRTRRELDAVLTPEQRAKAEAIRKRHPRPPGPPPPGDFPPGPPPR